MTANLNGKSTILGHRKAIIKAASFCIREKGICGCSMVDIASCSHMSVGQIYRCFKSKMEIVQESLKDNIDKQIELLTVIYSRPDPLDYILTRNVVQNKNFPEQFVWDLKVIFRTESMFHQELSSLLYHQEKTLTNKHLSLVKSGLLCLREYDVEVIPEVVDFLITETTMVRNIKKVDGKTITTIYKNLISSLKYPNV
ncbi:TetR/AcrR family transcriptional regulator [Enterobacter hormaechei]|uniref:TetR/AcrR family transcriptional regulator n=1 Tax=Enterobacter hormaechei TaxID=158836 RepID=UPI0039081B6F